MIMSLFMPSPVFLEVAAFSGMMYHRNILTDEVYYE